MPMKFRIICRNCKGAARFDEIDGLYARIWCSSCGVDVRGKRADRMMRYEIFCHDRSPGMDHAQTHLELIPPVWEFYLSERQE